MTDRSFSIDGTAIRDRARANMADGAVTESYGQDQRQVAPVLNDALATEIVCWLRYTRHAISATGINRARVSAEFSADHHQSLAHFPEP